MRPRALRALFRRIRALFSGPLFGPSFNSDYLVRAVDWDRHPGLQTDLPFSGGGGKQETTTTEFPPRNCMHACMPRIATMCIHARISCAMRMYVADIDYLLEYACHQPSCTPITHASPCRAPLYTRPLPAGENSICGIARFSGAVSIQAPSPKQYIPIPNPSQCYRYIYTTDARPVLCRYRTHMSPIAHRFVYMCMQVMYVSFHRVFLQGPQANKKVI